LRSDERRHNFWWLPLPHSHDFVDLIRNARRRYNFSMNPDLLSRRTLLASALVAAAYGAVAGELFADASSTKPARRSGRRHAIAPKMSFVANDRIKLGVDLALGGAITHVSPADDDKTNLINSYDLGRQVQMSYYSGPAPYRVEGHQGPPPEWNHIGWNPIQVGDTYGNPAKILEHRNDGKSIYIKCVPMQWALDHVPGECTFECWIELEGVAARVRSRINMSRADKTQWPARLQEMPAVYTNGRWHRLFTYTGDSPYTDDPKLTQIEHPFTMQSPWAHWQATERWAAQVDDKDWGLGVWSPETTHFGGGFAGKKGAGGPKDAPTGYIAPHRPEILDHNLVHTYQYALVLGDLKSIRRWVYAQPGSLQPPDWRFEKDRAGWTYHDATDGGWPCRGVLDITVTGKDAQLLSPPTAWQASKGGVLEVDLAVEGEVARLEAFWGTARHRDFAAERRLAIDLQPDGVRRTLRLDLRTVRGFEGLLTRLRLDVDGPVGTRLRVYRVAVVAGV